MGVLASKGRTCGRAHAGDLWYLVVRQQKRENDRLQVATIPGLNPSVTVTRKPQLGQNSNHLAAIVFVFNNKNMGNRRPRTELRVLPELLVHDRYTLAKSCLIF